MFCFAHQITCLICASVHLKTEPCRICRSREEGNAKSVAYLEAKRLEEEEKIGGKKIGKKVGKGGKKLGRIAE